VNPIYPLGELGEISSPAAANNPTLADQLGVHAPPAWTEDALCAQVDIGDIFFPDKGGSATVAKRICEQCSVRRTCLEYSLTNEERFGVWGGLTARERREYQRIEEAA